MREFCVTGTGLAAAFQPCLKLPLFIRIMAVSRHPKMKYF